MTRSKQLKNITQQNFGSEYYIPPNMSREEFIKLKKLWDEKLQNSGIFNIESQLDSNGTVSSYLYTDPNSREISGSHYNISKTLNNFNAEYYRLVSIFLRHAKFKYVFKGKGKLIREYKTLMNLHADGLSYREVVVEFNKRQKRYNKRLRSVYWVFTSIQTIVKEMYKWHHTDKNGVYYNHNTEPPDWLEVYVESISVRTPHKKFIDEEKND